MLKQSFLAVSIVTGLLVSANGLAGQIKLTHSSDDATRIVGGSEAAPHSLPYQVSLQSLDGSHFCGGSIIAEDIILTAAHCVEGASTNPELQVHVGAHNVNQPAGQRIRVATVYSHKEYPGLSKDVAVLKLSEKISDKNAKPVKLADKAFFDAHMKAGTMMTVSGWGALQSGGSVSDKLMEVDVPYVTNEVCNAPQSYNGQVQETEICGGYKEGGKDSCQGDSGGPLVVKDKNDYVQVGVVSWGDGCAAPDKYGVYANVAALNDWITNAVAGNEQPGGSGGDNGGDDSGNDTPSTEHTYFAVQDRLSWNESEEEIAFTIEVPEDVAVFYVATRSESGEVDLEVVREPQQGDINEAGADESDGWGDWDEQFGADTFFSGNEGSNESITVQYPLAGAYTIRIISQQAYKDLEFTILAH